jgi:hypothetical protein
MALHCGAPWHALASERQVSAIIAGFVCPQDTPAINRNNSASDQKTCKAGIVPALFRRHFFRFIPVWWAANAVVWNCLKSRFFLLHPAPVLHIQRVNLFSELVSIP